MPKKNKRVLVVDDENDARTFTETAILEIEGVETFTASSGDEGLIKARETQPDLIVMDVMMPGTDGFHTFKKLRDDSKTSKIPVIMLTGVAKATKVGFSGDDMGEYFGVKPAAFLEKPVDPKTLQDTVRQVLGL